MDNQIEFLEKLANDPSTWSHRRGIIYAIIHNLKKVMLLEEFVVNEQGLKLKAQLEELGLPNDAHVVDIVITLVKYEQNKVKELLGKEIDEQLEILMKRQRERNEYFDNGLKADVIAIDEGLNCSTHCNWPYCTLSHCAADQMAVAGNPERFTNYHGEKFDKSSGRWFSIDWARESDKTLVTIFNSSTVIDAMEVIQQAERRLMGERKLMQDLGLMTKRPMILGMDTNTMTTTEIAENIRLIEHDIETLGKMFIAGKMSKATRENFERHLHFKNFDIELLREALQKFNDLLPF